MSKGKMILKLTPKQEEKLNCICGCCDHDCTDEKCAYYKIIGATNPEEAQKEAILSWTNGVVDEIIQKLGRDIITKKRGGK